MYGDKIRNEHVRGSVNVAPVTKKITEKIAMEMSREGKGKRQSA